MPSWNDNSANLPDRETAIRAELAASGGGTLQSILASGNDAAGKAITGLGNPSLASDAVTKSYVDSAVTLSTILATSNDAGSSTITNLGTPSQPTDATTKAYVDSQVSSGGQTLSTILTTGNDAGGHTITNLGAPSVASDAVTKNYVDTKAAPALSSVLGVGNDAGAVKIVNLAAPTAQTDAATKGYVDALSFNNQTGTAYTLVLTDQGKAVTMNNAAANTLTIPLNASVAFPTGTQIIVRQSGAGQTTIAGAGGVTLVNPYSSFALHGQYAQVTLLKIGTDSWSVNGEVA